MKKITFLAILATTLLFTTSVMAVSLNQTADAVKSKGNSMTEIGSKKVCGDKLCSQVNAKSQMKHPDSIMQPNSMDINAMMDKMDKIHETHQQQMIQYWNSMTPQEQSQMYQNMQKMIEGMESMTIEQHMKMMSNMASMNLQQHANVMPNIDSKSMQGHMETMPGMDKTDYDKTKKNLATFDELDFDVFTNQKWDRLSESHSDNIIVHWPDGRQTEGIETHIEDLKAMFVYAPDTRIQEHPIKIASGNWTSVVGIIEGTFTEPMTLPDGTIIPPTGKNFKLKMVTIGHWNNGVMDEEYLFWDNLAFMKQIGLS